MNYQTAQSDISRKMGCKDILKSSPVLDGKLTRTPGAVVHLVTRGRKNPLWMGLPRRLAQLRELKGLPLLDLAALAQCAHTTVRNIEKGKHKTSIEIVERIAVALGVAPCWLAFGAEGPLFFNKKRPRAEQPDDDYERSGSFEGLFRGVGARLLHARKSKDLSMRQLGELAEVSHQVIKITESGESIPKVDTVEAVAFALGVSPCWLAFGEGEGPASNGGRS